MSQFYTSVWVGDKLYRLLAAGGQFSGEASWHILFLLKVLKFARFCFKISLRPKMTHKCTYKTNLKCMYMFGMKNGSIFRCSNFLTSYAFVHRIIDDVKRRRLL